MDSTKAALDSATRDIRLNTLREWVTLELGKIRTSGGFSDDGSIKDHVWMMQGKAQNELWTLTSEEFGVLKRMTIAEIFHGGHDGEPIGGLSSFADRPLANPQWLNDRCKMLRDSLLGLDSRYKCVKCEIVKDEILSRCGGCKVVRYCSPDCQTEHWKEHKKICKEIKALKKAGKEKSKKKQNEMPFERNGPCPCKSGEIFKHCCGST